MIAAVVWESSTREVGIASHLIAAVACGAAWVRSGRVSRLASALGLLELFLLLDAAFNWRWIVHGLLMNMAMKQHVYGERKLPQELILALLFAITSIAIIMTLGYLRGRPGACLSICGALISAALWFIEVISLHATDVILQRSLGRLMLVALMWMASSSMTAVGILWDVERQA